jgi:hypothetical protein
LKLIYKAYGNYKFSVDLSVNSDYKRINPSAKWLGGASPDNFRVVLGKNFEGISDGYPITI